MRLLYRWLGLLVVSAGVIAAPAMAQSDASRPNVFLDCNSRNCNSQYFRTEIDWVNWVNAREVADVHVIMTSERTGAGGQRYQLDLIGVDDQAGYEDTQAFQTLPTDTDREALDGITHTLGIGLASFANQAGFRGLVQLMGPDPESSNVGTRRTVSAAEVDDPWNLWVFRVNGSGNLDAESTRSNTRVNGSINASRVTPTWKMNFFGNMNLNRVEIDLEDGTFTDTRTDWGFNPLVVYTVAEKWSVGLQGEVARRVRFNQSFRAELTPAVEYSVFPYTEATRRSFTFFYKVGPAYRDYIEPTIFGETEETRWEQSLSVNLAQRQEWGDAGVRITGSHYLHDTDRYNLNMRGDIDYRIVRGVSVRAEANVAWVDDQIYLPADEATDEEALLSLQQRASSFNYGIELGFSIQFGSIFNNVVNNRFGGGGGGGFGRRF